jgi:outer membrane protein TolC
MKNKIAVLLVVFISLFTLQVFAEETNLTVPEYLQLVLDNSTALETAEANAESAAEAYDEAVINQVSAFDLELFRINAEYSSRNILTVQNAEIIAAVQHYFTFTGMESSLKFAETNSEISGDELQRNQERFSSDLISINTLEQSELAYLTSLQSLKSAESNLRGQEKQIFRPLGIDWEGTGFTDFMFNENSPQLPGKKELITENPFVLKLEAEIAVKAEKQIQLTGSTFVTPSELEQIADDLESLRNSLQNQVWSLEDALYDYTAGNDTSTLSLQAAELQVGLALRQLENIKLQMEQGEIYSSDVAQAELPYLQALENRQGTAQNRFMEDLEIRALMNESLLPLFE